MRRLVALFGASVVLAGLLLVPMASGVAAADTVYPNGGWTCYAHGTIAGGPSTTKSSVLLNLTNPSQSKLGCVWNNSAIPTSFGGACRFENDLFVADFRRRLLINTFGTVSLACLDAVITDKTDLRIIKTDGVTSAVPGTFTTYTITVTNAGALPGNAVIGDTFPAAVTGATWTAVGAGGASGFTASGSGNIADTANLPAGANVTYTVIAPIDPSATGTLANTATVAAGPNTIDTNPANNSATDTDTLTPRVDLAVTVDDGVTTVTGGQTVTYTITVTNNGPSTATGIVVSVIAICPGICSFDGTGVHSSVASLGPGANDVGILKATTGIASSGTMTASVGVSSPQTDTNPANNNATDTDTVTPAT